MRKEFVNGLIGVLIVLGVIYAYLVYYAPRAEGFASGAGAGDGAVDTFTLYYADWCPHCKTVKPVFKEWSNAGSIKVNGKTVFLQMVEESEKEKMAGKPVRGFPTFLLERADGRVTEFEGSRTPEGWEEWLKKNL